MSAALILVGCLVTNDLEQILLLRRDDGTWQVPATEPRIREHLEDAALRAVREATGLTGSITGALDHIPADEVTGQPGQRIFRFALATNPAPIHPASHGLGWFHSDNLPGVAPAMAALLRRYAPSRRRLPRDQWLETTPRSWTCTAAIVTGQNGRLLLVKAAEARFWQFVGGMIDAHETGPEGAARELRE